MLATGLREPPDVVIRNTGIYRFTSIGRPLDPAYPTNRGVLQALPIVAAVAAVVAYAGFADFGPSSAALAAALSAFAAWAVTRELCPDDNAAAFVSLVYAAGAQLLFGPVSVIPLFVALVLTRIVNRTTGLEPRKLDAVLVTGFILWAMSSLSNPMIGIVAAVAFFLDASLHRAARWQLVSGFVCFIASIVAVLRDGVALPAISRVDSPETWVLLALLVIYLMILAGVQEILSVGDVSGEQLDPARVRAGMFVTAFLAATEPGPIGNVPFNPLPWACIAGVVTSDLLGRVHDLVRPGNKA